MYTTAVEYLAKPDSFQIPPVIVLMGEDAYLRAEVYKLIRTQVLGEEDADFSLAEYEGNSVAFSDIAREVSIRPMFGGDFRLVRILEADSFVSAYTKQLMSYLETPSAVGILVLQMKTLLSTNSFYKEICQKGLLVNVKPLEKDGVKAWVQTRGHLNHLVFDSSASQVLIDMVGCDAGLIDNELKRLALIAPPNGRITQEFLFENVGLWSVRTAWDIVDDVLDGNLPKAVKQFNLLLTAGEQPIGIFAPMAFQLRKLALATYIYLKAERSGRRITLENAARAAKCYKPEKIAEQMKKLGRQRGLKIPSLLLEADLNLKGGSRIDPRIILEELMAKLSSPKMR